MKDKLKIIVFSCVAVTAAFALAAGVYIALKFAHGPSAPTGAETSELGTDISDTLPVDSETDAESISETEAYISSEPQDTERETDEQGPSGDELDRKCREIASWVEANTPIYRKTETNELGEELESEYKPPVAFYYLDLESGRSMAYNEDRVFFAASVIKAPYVMYALREAEEDPKREDYRLDNIFVYTEDKYKEGSGVIQKSEFGTEYTYEDLLRLTVTQSDNIAFAYLRTVYSRKGFNEFSESLGVTTPTKSLYKITAAESAAYLSEIYNYFLGGSEGALMLREWMMSTNHRIMIPRALSPTPVAHKYGWDIDAYHDTAVVFDDHPYALVILTELDNGSGADNKFIRELAVRIDEAHREAWEKGTDDDTAVS